MDAYHTAARAFSWAGAVLFAVAIGYFLFTYSVRFGDITPGPIEPRSVLIDIALFSAFALHHSIFARDRVRDRIRRLFPAPLERSVYVWIASLMLIGICAAWRPIPGVAWQLQGPAWWLAIAAQLSGVWLTLRSASVIDGLELAGVRQAPGAGTMEFKTAGPYGWVRHPIYLGWILIVFSVGTMTMTRLVFAAVSSVYILIAIPLEEGTLRRASGGAYDGYAQRVPWKLLPRVY